MLDTMSVKNGEPEFVGEIQIRQDINVLPANDPKDIKKIEDIFYELYTSIKEQAIPDCLRQFGLKWRSPEYRNSKYFSFAAKCKGMTSDEYSLFLDKKVKENI